MVFFKPHALKLKLPWLDFIVASLINAFELDLLHMSFIYLMVLLLIS